MSHRSGARCPRGVIGVAAIGLLILSQSITPSRGEAFGPATMVHTVSAPDFHNAGTGSENAGGDFDRFCVVGVCNWFAGLALPSGAQVTAVELAACDNTSSFGMTVQLFRRAYTATVLEAVSPVGGTGVGQAAGCAIFPAPLATPETIDNEAFQYLVKVISSAGDVNLKFGSVRVLYSLHVSPAPATATFGDVPASHPFYQFVEALVASGITAGCGGGNYCPDAPLTRGQMAVFLSKGLGLHFAP